jgi:DNA-binding beta-propeller fold protein YncE
MKERQLLVPTVSVIVCRGQLVINVRLNNSVYRAAALLACFSAITLLACCGGSGGSSSNGGNPPPPPVTQLTSLNPPSIQVGSPAFQLTINGANFDPSCAVQLVWDGGQQLANYTNVYVSTTELQLQIPAAQVAVIGSIEVILDCQDGAPDTPFLVTGFPRIQINQAANDLVWDPVHQVIYLSVPPTVPGGSGIAVLNPATAQIVSFTPLGNNPDVLAISDDAQYLYVALDDSSSIQRFILPELTPDIEFPINEPGDYPLDIQVAPGTPHTTAVSIGNPLITTPASGVMIFDDGQPRPTSTAAPGQVGTGGECNCDFLQWGSTISSLYSVNTETSGFDFYSLSVNSSGVSLYQDYPDVFRGFNGDFGNHIHYLASNGLVYGDDGTVVNPSTGTVVGIFTAPFYIGVNQMVPDSTLGVAAFLSAVNCIYDGPGGCFVVVTFRLSDLSYLNYFTMSGIQDVNGPINMVRWGPSGLAFNTDTGQVYLVDISSLLQSASTPGAFPPSSHRSLSLQNHDKILTTTKRRFSTASSNR